MIDLRNRRSSPSPPRASCISDFPSLMALPRRMIRTHDVSEFARPTVDVFAQRNQLQRSELSSGIVAIDWPDTGKVDSPCGHLSEILDGSESDSIIHLTGTKAQRLKKSLEGDVLKT